MSVHYIYTSLLAAVALRVAVCAEPSNPSTTARIYHRGDTLMVEINGKETKFPLAELQSKQAEFKVKLGKGESVFFHIEDPNTLLFNYTLGERTEKEIQDYADLKGFAQGFASMIKLAVPVNGIVSVQSLKALAPSRVPAEGEIVEVAIDASYIRTAEYFEVLTRLSHLFLEIDGLVTRSIVARDAATAQAVGRDFHEQWIKDKADITRMIEFLLALESAAIASTPVIVRYAEDGGKLQTRLYPHLGEFFEAHPAKKDATSVESFNHEQVLHIEAIYGARSRIKALRDSVAGFADALVNYWDAAEKGIGVGVVKGDQKKEITQEILITQTAASATGDAILTHQKAHAGGLKAIVVPRQWVHMRAGVGAIYSFLKNPEFSAAKQEDGKFVITKTDNSYNEVSGAATLNFYSDKYWEQSVEPFAQLGYAHADDEKGILLGIGLRIYEKFTLSSGVIYQQARSLAEGQIIGTLLEKESDLKIEKNFKPALYIQVGYQF